MILFFSGCGNSQFVAEQLAKLTNDTIARINPADSTPVLNLSEGEALGIVCPVYAWAIPNVVQEFIGRLAVKGSPEYCYLACTCGDNVGKTPERLASLLHKKGIVLNAAFGFVMPETYINVPGFNLDSEEVANAKIEAVKKRLVSVASHIANRDRVIDVVRGNVPWLNSYIVNPLFYALLVSDKKFNVNDNCISCGLCQKSCPLENITMESGRPVWHGNCTSCMACYHHCPKNAINFGKSTVGKGQYFFGIF